MNNKDLQSTPLGVPQELTIAVNQVPRLDLCLENEIVNAPRQRAFVFVAVITAGAKKLQVLVRFVIENVSTMEAINICCEESRLGTQSS